MSIGAIPPRPKGRGLSHIKMNKTAIHTILNMINTPIIDGYLNYVKDLNKKYYVKKVTNQLLNYITVFEKAPDNELTLEQVTEQIKAKNKYTVKQYLARYPTLFVYNHDDESYTLNKDFSGYIKK